MPAVAQAAPGGFITDRTIVRFLIARNMDVKVTSRLLQETMPWWSKRNPSYIITDPEDARAKQLAHENLTGKVGSSAGRAPLARWVVSGWWID